MKIGDDFLLDSMPRLQPARPLGIDNDEQADEKAPGKFDELFNTVFAASNTSSQELSAASRESTAKLMTGELDDLTEHMVTSEKSSLQFELNLRIRNKVLDAYSEVMKFQV